MKKSSTIISWVIVILVILIGWYLYSIKVPDEASAPTPSGALGLNGSPDQTNTGENSVTPVVTVATDPKLGNYLVASNGMTLYTYTKDTSGVSNCTDACAQNWPPYLHTTPEPLLPGDGITGELGTITRKDGSAQLTYKGMPLYFWKNDNKPGDTTGQNVGKVWFIAKP